MMFSITRRLCQGGSAESAAHQWMTRIAARVPSTGLSGSQLQALLEDEFPSFSPSISGAVTLKEAVQRHPDVWRVEEGNNLQSKWYVRPVSTAVLSTSATRSPVSDKSRAPLQKLRRFCAKRASRGDTSYVSLEWAMARTGIADVSVVDDILRSTSHGLDVQVGVRVRPRRIPRSVVAFVDGDALPPVAVDEMCNELGVMKPSSTVTIVRQRGSSPLSSVDVVCPDVLSTSLCIERHACELRLRRPDVREDVVYMCSAAQFQTYAEHVAPLNAFPDADVYVCCPSKVELVQPKTVLPFA